MSDVDFYDSQFAAQAVREDDLGDVAMQDFLNGQSGTAGGNTQTLTSGQLSQILGRTTPLPFQKFPLVPGAGPTAYMRFAGWPVLQVGTVNPLALTPQPYPAPPREDDLLFIQSPDQNAEIHTVTFAQRSNQSPYMHNGAAIVPYASPSARVHLQWGTGGGLSDAWFDIGRGGTISVAGSIVRAWGSILGQPGGQAVADGGSFLDLQLVSAFVGSGSRIPPRPLRVTEAFRVGQMLPKVVGLSDIAVLVSLVPPFATDLIVTRNNIAAGPNAGYQGAFTMEAFDAVGGLLLRREFVTGVPMVIPEPIPDGTMLVRLVITQDPTNVVDQYVTMSYGLTL